MNNPERSTEARNRSLAKLGGRYILRAQAASQVIATPVGLSIGLYFIFSNASLSRPQIILLLPSLTLFILLTYLVISIYVRISTRQARARLDHIFRESPLLEGSEATSAWMEILTLPRRAAAARFISAYLLVVLPTALYMHQAGAANWSQVAVIAIGLSFAEMAILIQGILFLDERLTPARQALLPGVPSQQEAQTGLGQRVRQYFVLFALLLGAILMTGMLGRQQLVSVAAPEALARFQTQFAILGAILVVLAIFFASRLHRAAALPVREMIDTINAVQHGDLSRRASLVASDETARLSIHLNQLLDQLQTAQTELERTVEERTSELTRKTVHFQAAAQVAREATALQDINTLLSRTVDLISGRFGYYHAGIFLLDDAGEFAILQAASSEGGKRMLARGHRLEVGHQGIVGAAAFQNRPYIVMDVSGDTAHFKNPDLPMTRSEAAIPLTGRGRVIGVLDIQSTEQSAFTQDDVEIFRILADQIGLAIQNARSIAESQDAFQRLEAITAENMRRVWRERLQTPKRAYRYTSVSLAPIPPGEVQEPGDSKPDRLNIPITLRGQRIGVIALRRTSENPWNDTDRSLALEIASQVGLALENARLLDDAQRRAAQEQSLNELTTRLSRSLDPDTLLQTAVRELHQLPNVSEVSVYISPPRPANDDKPQPSHNPDA